MRTVYIEPVTFKCHTAQNAEGTRIPIEEDFFNGKCDIFIEGFRLKPEGESWKRSDGKVFEGGRMISPWKPYAELDAAQREYERAMLAEYESLIDELYSEVTS